jgi:hypothetical protein
MHEIALNARQCRLRVRCISFICLRGNGRHRRSKRRVHLDVVLPLQLWFESGRSGSLRRDTARCLSRPFDCARTNHCSGGIELSFRFPTERLHVRAVSADQVFLVELAYVGSGHGPEPTLKGTVGLEDPCAVLTYCWGDDPADLSRMTE